MNEEILTCQECGQPQGKIIDSAIGLLILCKKCFFKLTSPKEGSMKARCGLEDCDCEYTIGSLERLLKQAVDIVEEADGPRMGRFWLPNFLAGARYAIHLTEEGRPR